MLNKIFCFSRHTQKVTSGSFPDDVLTRRDWAIQHSNKTWNSIRQLMILSDNKSKILSTIIQPLIRFRASILLSLETVKLQGHLIWMDQIAFGFWQQGKHPDATSLDCRTEIFLVILCKTSLR